MNIRNWLYTRKIKALNIEIEAQQCKVNLLNEAACEYAISYYTDRHIEESFRLSKLKSKLALYMREFL